MSNQGFQIQIKIATEKGRKKKKKPKQQRMAKANHAPWESRVIRAEKG